MFKTLNEAPSEEVQQKFAMTISQEDSYMDYRIRIAGRSQDEIAEIAELFDIDKNELATKETLTLSVLLSH